MTVAQNKAIVWFRSNAVHIADYFSKLLWGNAPWLGLVIFGWDSGHFVFHAARAEASFSYWKEPFEKFFDDGRQPSWHG
jgi:hypothetical protein